MPSSTWPARLLLDSSFFFHVAYHYAQELMGSLKHLPWTLLEVNSTLFYAHHPAPMTVPQHPHQPPSLLLSTSPAHAVPVTSAQPPIRYAGSMGHDLRMQQQQGSSSVEQLQCQQLGLCHKEQCSSMPKTPHKQMPTQANAIMPLCYHDGRCRADSCVPRPSTYQVATAPGPRFFLPAAVRCCGRVDTT